MHIVNNFYGWNKNCCCCCSLAEKKNQIYSIATRHVCNHIIDCLGIIACSQTNTKHAGCCESWDMQTYRYFFYKITIELLNDFCLYMQ